MREEKSAIVVEGYMDVISSWQVGIRHMVAPCGTALTKEQITVLARKVETLYLLYDADTAGQEAIVRNSLVCLEDDVHPRIITLGDDSCKDVDDYWKTHSLEEFRERLALAKPFIEHYMDMLKETYNFEQVQLKRKAVDLFLEALLKVQNQVEVQEYLRMASHAFAVDGSVLLSEFHKKKQPGKVIKKVTKEDSSHPFSSPSHVLMAALLAFPTLLAEFPVLQHFETLPEEFPTVLLQFVRKEADFDEGIDLVTLLPESIRDKGHMLLLYAQEHGVLDSAEQAKQVMTEKLRTLVEAKKKELLSQMQTAQTSKDAKGWFTAYTLLAELQKTA